MKGQPSNLNITTTVEWNRRLRATYAAVSSDQFIKTAFELLRATVPCELILFHDLSAKGDAPTVHASNGKRYQFSSMTETLLSATPTIRRLPHTVPAQSALSQSGDPRAEASIFSEIFDPLGIQHGVSLLFRDTHKLEIPENAFSVFRSGRHREFSGQELSMLENTHGHLETAMKCLKSRLSVNSKHNGLAAIIRNLPLGTVVVDRHLRFVHANRKGLEHCSAWLHAPRLNYLKVTQKECKLPDEIKTVCRDLQREWTVNLRSRDSPKFNNVRLILHDRDPTLQATATLLCPRASLLPHPSFLIQTERLLPDTTVTQGSQNPCLNLLTISEREVTLGAAKGLSNQEIADEIGKTVSAVKFLLHSTFKKLQVPSRAQLVARLCTVEGGNVHHHSRPLPTKISTTLDSFSSDQSTCL